MRELSINFTSKLVAKLKLMKADIGVTDENRIAVTEQLSKKKS
jgi:hypothetical protein